MGRSETRLLGDRSQRQGGPSEVITLGRGYRCLGQPNAQVGYGKPVPIMLEQVRGPLVEALMSRENIFALSGQSEAIGTPYRESFPGGDKDDPHLFI